MQRKEHKNNNNNNLITLSEIDTEKDKYTS